MDLFRELFGDHAEEALEQMKEMGLDPEKLSAEAGIAFVPGMLENIVAQVRALVEQSKGLDVNWEAAMDMARGVAARGGDPVVSSAIAAEHRRAISEAELWLDAVTEFAPSTATPRILSHVEWVETTLPTWRHLAGPVAVSVSQAIGKFIAKSMESHTGLLSQIGPTVTGFHMGQAAGTLGREAFGGTDLGLLLVPEARVVLVPNSIREFSAGLDVPLEEILAFVALRECAHIRLFLHAPWLAGQLHSSIERYAHEVSIDEDLLFDAMREAEEGNPVDIQKAISRGIFVGAHSDEQLILLESIETLLALIEGWVEAVIDAAGSPHLPHLQSLEEMMRRRRAAGGPAEHTFATLLGLDLRPRRLREAAGLWTALTRIAGPAGRDAVWSHPDLLPTSDDLDDPTAWVADRVAEESSDEVDRELRDLLAGKTPPAAHDPHEGPRGDTPTD